MLIKNLSKFIVILITLAFFAAFDVFFVNDTPRVQGGSDGTVYAELRANRETTRLRCRLIGFDRQKEDCKH